jgi:hypothetical protein
MCPIDQLVLGLYLVGKGAGNRLAVDYPYMYAHGFAWVRGQLKGPFSGAE